MDALVAAGLVVSFLITPLVLVWPRAYGRLLIPPVLRPGVARRPLTWAFALAVPVAGLAGGSVCIGLLGGLVHPTNGATVQGVVLVWILIGGLTLWAFSRAVLIGAREWRVTARPGPGSRFLPVVDLFAVESRVSHARDDAELDRPADRVVDRRLRGSARWLGAAGLGWYFFGRALQGIGLGSGGDSGVPDWWWFVTVILLALGAGVWTARRLRWWRQPKEPVPDLLRELGFGVVRPGGEWVREAAPGVFLPPGAGAGPSLWEWAATGRVGGRVMLVAEQHVQARHRIGLTAGLTRTACAVRLPGVDLPVVRIAGREAIPPTLLRHSIDLELIAFNRALWAWGPDPRGFHAIVHPRAMQAILPGLPDGAVLTIGRDLIAVYCDEPVPASRIADYVWLVARLADAVPGYIVNPVRPGDEFRLRP